MAVCAAAVKFVAICLVTDAYSVGFDCRSCCNVLNNWAKGDNWLLSEAEPVTLLVEVLPVVEVVEDKPLLCNKLLNSEAMLLE